MPLQTSETLSFTFALGLELLFYLLLLFFTLHAVFLSYHWFNYGSDKKVSIIALAVYLSGGAMLFLTFAIALQTL